MEWETSSILEEDDYLIQPTPKPPKPPPPRRCLNLNLISPIKPVNPNCSSHKDTTNKENVTASTNKSEGPKLNMEPMQMKKKKKVGGYNLRKSLAWNKAFFTEEGVLDPIELSMISGTLGDSSKVGLSAINEEPNDCLSLSPAECLRKDREENVYLPPKHTSSARTQQASTSMVSRKVLSTHAARRTGPANINAYKAVTKDSKLPKLPFPKPGHSSLPGNLATSSKKNQILRPVVNVQRNVEIKSYPKSVKVTQSKAKAGSEPLLNKSSASHAKRNKVNPPANLHASTHLCPVVGNRVNNSGPKVTPKDVPPSVKAVSSKGRDVTSQLAASLPQNNAITGRTLQHFQVQLAKPSGLRMPSPSLGFFGQSKASVSHNFSQRVVDSNHRVGKLDDRRPPQSPSKIPESVNSNMQIENAMASSSRYVLNAVSNQTIAQGVGEDAMKDGETISHEQSCAQSAVDVNGGRITIKNPCEEETFGNYGVIDHDVPVESQTGSVNKSIVPNSVMLMSNTLSCVQDIHQPSSLQTHSLKASSVEEYLVPDVDKPSIVKEGSSEKLVGDLQNCASEDIGYNNFETSEPTSLKLENSEFSSQHLHTSLLEDSFMRNEITDNSHIKETVLEIPNMILTARRCKNSLEKSLEIGDLDNPSVSLLGSQTTCLEFEQISNSIHGLLTYDCMSEQSQKEVIETLDERVKSEIDNSGAEVAEVFGGMEKEGFDSSKMAGEDILRNLILGSVEVCPPVADHDCLLDANVGSAVILSGEASSLDLHSYSSEEPDLKVVGAPGSFNRKKLSREVDEKNLTIPEPADQILCGGPYLESQIADVNQISVSSESDVCDKEQKMNLQNIVETDSSLNGYSRIDLEKFSTLPQDAFAMQISEYGTEAANASNISQTGDDSEYLADGNVPVQCFMGHTSVACDQYAAGANFTEESEQTELPNCCTFFEEVSKYNNELLLRNCLHEETTEFENSKKGNVLRTGIDANPEKGEPSEIELKSSRAFPDASLSPPLKFNGHDGTKVNGGSCIDESRSSCMEIKFSSEKCKLFSGSQLRHGVELGGLLLEGDLTPPRSLNQSVQLTNSTLTGENNPEVCQDVDSRPVDTNYDLDTSLCQEEDENATLRIGSNNSVSTSNETNLMILPPRNAVPFSDEWLAAIEAAGEEILTMKSGAVQNSPPDKSLPEPSPWSPVKRKNNSIGPYDCTKFTNNMSSDPQ
ncbi:hypothetical protein ACH5RR_009945 [Cinchona calisaya]|uniref:Uncharacterized protein n=1 Tax=Cinchona calisaya TaxID=153742 RepID=A0ABD3AGE3_9GENT